MTAPKTKTAPYNVGYGKPPRHTQFRKGRSGNPHGRPRAAGRLKALTLQEAYRAVVVKEDGRAVPVTAMQAILRSQVELAAEGNVQAQRAILRSVRRFEEQIEWDAAWDAMLQPWLEAAASHLGMSMREFRKGLWGHEPDAVERDMEESNVAPALPATGAPKPERGEASAAPPSSPPLSAGPLLSPPSWTPPLPPNRSKRYARRSRLAGRDRR